MLACVHIVVCRGRAYRIWQTDAKRTDVVALSMAMFLHVLFAHVGGQKSCSRDAGILLTVLVSNVSLTGCEGGLQLTYRHIDKDEFFVSSSILNHGGLICCLPVLSRHTLISGVLQVENKSLLFFQGFAQLV
jgi:hypothetical protein